MKTFRQGTPGSNEHKRTKCASLILCVYDWRYLSRVWRIFS